jgi:ELWxxDGT repeat protein
MVKNIRIGCCPFVTHELTAVDGLLYFTANDGTHGDELWRSDGTAAGTFMIKDVNSLLYSQQDLTEMNGLLYFTANDGTHGSELWAYAPWLGFVVAPLAGPHGSISPDTRQMIEQDGAPVFFTVTPDEGYVIADVTGCDGILNGNIYTTGVITVSCEVIASFQAIDNDSDGIGDSWEILHFSNLTTADATSDYDQDNYSDLQEYLNWFNEKLDPEGNSYDPKEKNVPGGEGYHNPNGWLPAVLKLLLMR